MKLQNFITLLLQNLTLWLSPFCKKITPLASAMFLISTSKTTGLPELPNRRCSCSSTLGRRMSLITITHMHPCPYWYVCTRLWGDLFPIMGKWTERRKKPFCEKRGHWNFEDGEVTVLIWSNDSFYKRSHSVCWISEKHSKWRESKSNPNMQKDRFNQVIFTSNSIIQLELNKVLYQTT